MIPWDELLDTITEGHSVVPVIGRELLMVDGEGGTPVPFQTRLAQRCASRLKEKKLKVPEDAPLSVQAKLAVKKDLEFGSILYAEHQALLGEFSAVAAASPTLQLLMEIHDFPLYVATSTEGLLAKTLGLEKHEILDVQIGKAIDLPMGWQPGQAPRLFHLFGRIAAGTESAVTEEDTLEYLSHLHGEGRPPRLLSHLRQSHLLFLGNGFPDWLARVFLRLVRAERFTGGKKVPFDALADPEARGTKDLAAFLKAYSPKTHVHSEGDSSHFVQTLHANWMRRGEAKNRKTTILAGEGNVAPEPMQRAAIFISYASENLKAAEKLAAALSTKHLPVWLDRRQLQGGDNYAYKIAENIRRCRLFVPLLSTESANRKEGWFRQEWQQCRERLKRVGPRLTFVVPVAIDESKVYDDEDLVYYFKLAEEPPHVLHCPAGEPASELLEQFVDIYRAATRMAAPV